MLPSMRLYIISIVSFFAALGIGIFIGFTINAQDFVIKQNEYISDIIESQLELLIEENKNLKENLNELSSENQYKDEYIDNSYGFLIENKLKGLRIGIVETGEDYVTSSIGKDLEIAGAKVLNVTTISNDIMDKERLDDIFQLLDYPIPENSVEMSMALLTESIITNTIDPIFYDLIDIGYIKTMGRYDEEIDYLVLCGGSTQDPTERFSQIDRIIVEVARNNNTPLIGVEKSKAKHSYTSEYQRLGLSTIDNVDMTTGRTAMILAISGLNGNYGIKKNAESLIPSSSRIFQE